MRTFQKQPHEHVTAPWLASRACVFFALQVGMSKRLNMVKPEMAVHQEKMQDIKMRVSEVVFAVLQIKVVDHKSPASCAESCLVLLVYRRQTD